VEPIAEDVGHEQVATVNAVQLWERLAQVGHFACLRYDDNELLRAFLRAQQVQRHLKQKRGQNLRREKQFRVYTVVKIIE